MLLIDSLFSLIVLAATTYSRDDPSRSHSRENCEPGFRRMLEGRQAWWHRWTWQESTAWSEQCRYYNTNTKQNLNRHKLICTLQDKGKCLSLPNSVRVPVLMDDDLGGADSHRTTLICNQIVLPQVDSIGATAAWPQNMQKHGSELLWPEIYSLLLLLKKPNN